ncbi:hypothetical protein BY996DRAFT_6545825 [Phakopsora pachyrhizi]|nr:hypothetical protein BY996DRAFT_6545825 [Phakopsora pachyrhizi]
MLPFSKELMDLENVTTEIIEGDKGLESLDYFSQSSPNPKYDISQDWISRYSTEISHEPRSFSLSTSPWLHVEETSGFGLDFDWYNFEDKHFKSFNAQGFQKDYNFAQNNDLKDSEIPQKNQYAPPLEAFQSSHHSNPTVEFKRVEANQFSPKNKKLRVSGPSVVLFPTPKSQPFPELSVDKKERISTVMRDISKTDMGTSSPEPREQLNTMATELLVVENSSMGEESSNRFPSGWNFEWEDAIYQKNIFDNAYSKPFSKTELLLSNVKSKNHDSAANMIHHKSNHGTPLSPSLNTFLPPAPLEIEKISKLNWPKYNSPLPNHLTSMYQNSLKHGIIDSPDVFYKTKKSHHMSLKSTRSDKKSFLENTSGAEHSNLNKHSHEGNQKNKVNSNNEFLHLIFAKHNLEEYPTAVKYRLFETSSSVETSIHIQDSIKRLVKSKSPMQISFGKLPPGGLTDYKIYLFQTLEKLNSKSAEFASTSEKIMKQLARPSYAYKMFRACIEISKFNSEDFNHRNSKGLIDHKILYLTWSTDSKNIDLGKINEDLFKVTKFDLPYENSDRQINWVPLLWKKAIDEIIFQSGFKQVMSLGLGKDLELFQNFEPDFYESTKTYSSMIVKQNRLKAAVKVLLSVSNKIVLFYRIFTPMDYFWIQNLRENLVVFFNDSREFLYTVFDVKNFRVGGSEESLKEESFNIRKPSKPSNYSSCFGKPDSTTIGQPPASKENGFNLMVNKLNKKTKLGLHLTSKEMKDQFKTYQS